MDVMSQLLSSIMDNIMSPILAVLGVALVFIFKNRFDKISKSIVAKNEIAEMKNKNTIRKELMEIIASNVEAAVASNMQIAAAMKSGGRKLTDADVKTLNESAKTLIMNSLPDSLTKEGEPLNDIIGGTTKLHTIIDALMEKYVYEYKVKQLTPPTNDNTK